MTNKLIIWDLCGGSQNSAYFALKDENVQIYTFDINGANKAHNAHITIDLTDCKAFYECVKDIPKPDIIFASPNCAAFGVMNHAAGARLGINENGDLRNIKDIEHLINCNRFFKGRKADKEQHTAKLGLHLLKAVVYIILQFKPKAWYIENPQASFMWEVIRIKYPELSGYKNVAYYNNYNDNFSLKPTIFYSNVKLDLLHTYKKTPFKISLRKNDTSTCINKSSNEKGGNVKIPHELIQDIFKKFKEFIWKKQ